MTNYNFKRGEIYLADLEPSIGSEQNGTRPVLILQNNKGNWLCPTLIVSPITSRIWKKSDLPTHYQIDNVKYLDSPSMVLLEQIMTIDKQCIIKYLGELNETQMLKINDCIKISLGFIDDEVY